MVDFISPIEATTLVRKKKRRDPINMTLCISSSLQKNVLLRLKIPLPEEETASSSKHTLDHPNLAKGVKQYLGHCIGHALNYDD
jgi:hypothetical protein